MISNISWERSIPPSERKVHLRRQYFPYFYLCKLTAGEVRLRSNKIQMTTGLKNKSITLAAVPVRMAMLVLSLLSLIFLTTECASEQKQESPNILFIAVDDLKPMLNCFGESQIVSPNIDMLAREGTLFGNNHCQQAVCGPSRASLMTGLRPDHTGIRDLKTRMRDVHPDILSLPQYFKQQGYTTVAFGKIYDPRCVGRKYDSVSWSFPYISDPDLKRPQGIEEPMFGHYQKTETRKRGQDLLEEAANKGLLGYEQVKYGLETLKPVVESADVPDNAYYDGIMIEHAISKLDELSKKDEPFFLAVGFKKPHLPFVAPSRYWDLYKRDSISLAGYRKMSRNGPKIAYHKSGELRSYTGFEFINDTIPDDQQQEIIHGYYAAVSYIDVQVGKIVDHLKTLGLAENTIIVLWGDHGWHLGDHNLWCKHSNFEQATRSPLIITAPGMPKNIRIDSPTEFIDIFPTLCELSGLPVPGNLDGVSLKSLIAGEKTEVKDFAVSQFPRGSEVMGYTIRTDRYRYTEWHGNSYLSQMPYNPDNIVGKELYDYQEDPLESINCLEDPVYSEVASELAALMVNFFKTQEIKQNEL